MGNSITGIDVSSWQHADGKPIDWEKVYEAGYRFAIVKATQGTSYVNPWVAYDLSDAGAAGLLLGAYHYFEAGEDPAVQAKWLINCTQGQPLDLGVFVDWECYSPAKFVHTQELTTFLGEARQTRPQCGVYCSADWATILSEESVQIGRLWVPVPPDRPAFSCFMWQHGASMLGADLSWSADVNQIDNTRGLDIPTSPPERPSVNTTHSVRALVEAETVAEDPEHNPTDDTD